MAFLFESFLGLNWLAIFIATLGALVFKYLLYGLFLREQWSDPIGGNNKSLVTTKNRWAFMHEFIWGFLRFFVIGLLIDITNVATLLQTLVVMLLLVLGLCVPAYVSEYLWKRTALWLLIIQLIEVVISLLLGASILFYMG